MEPNVQKTEQTTRAVADALENAVKKRGGMTSSFYNMNYGNSDKASTGQDKNTDLSPNNGTKVNTENYPSEKSTGADRARDVKTHKVDVNDRKFQGSDTGADNTTSTRENASRRFNASATSYNDVLNKNKPRIERIPSNGTNTSSQASSRPSPARNNGRIGTSSNNETQSTRAQRVSRRNGEIIRQRGSVRGSDKVRASSNTSSTAHSSASTNGTSAVRSSARDNSTFTRTDTAPNQDKASGFDESSSSVLDKDIQTGYYIGRAKVDASGIVPAAAGVVRSQINESEANHGYMQTKRYARLFGLSSGNHKATYKASTTNLLKRDDLTEDDIKRLHALFDKKKKNEKDPSPTRTYAVGKDLSGNNAKDYYLNVYAVEEYLTKYNINAKNLSYNEIQSALKKNRLLNYYHHGSTIHIESGSDLEFALKELAHQRKYQDQFGKLKGGKGRLRKTADAWADESLNQSEVYQTYEMLRTGYNVGKATCIASKGAFDLTVSSTVTVVEVGGTVFMKGAKIFTKDGDKKRKWMTREANLHKGSANLKNKTHSAMQNTVAGVAGRGIKKGSLFLGNKFLNSSLGKQLANSKLGRGSSFLYRKFVDGRTRWVDFKIALRSNKVIKTATAPLRFISFVKNKKTIIVAGGVAALLICNMMTSIISGVVTAVASILPQCAQSEDPTLDSTLQQTLDDLWAHHKGYMMNLQKGGETDYALYPIPDSWYLEMIDAVKRPIKGEEDITCEVNKSYCHKDLGFELKHYWGPKTAVYSSNELVTVCKGHDESGASLGSTTSFVSMVGPAGVNGDVGQYMGGYGNLNFSMNDTNIATLLDSSENKEIKVNFEYRGSLYSTEFTEDKYEKYYKNQKEVEQEQEKTEEENPGSDNEEEDTLGETYDIVPMYKAFTSLAIGFIENNPAENIEDEAMVNNLVYRYNKKLFDATIEKVRIDVSYENLKKDPQKTVSWQFKDSCAICNPEPQQCTSTGYTRAITINVTLTDTGIQDIIQNDDTDDTWAHNNLSKKVYEIQHTSAENYHPWLGWWTVDEEGNTIATDAQDVALLYYNLGEEEWNDFFEGIKFPGDTAMPLTQSEIKSILDQLKEKYNIDGQQEYFLMTALESIGEFYYKYGGGHPADPTFPPGGLDCSGYVSLIMYRGGLDSTYTPRTAQAFASAYNSVTYDGDYNNLKPGYLVIRNGEAGTNITSSNHVAIYLGEVQMEGDETPKHYWIECTTGTDRDGNTISGSMLTTTNKSDYAYARDPFIE